MFIWPTLQLISDWISPAWVYCFTVLLCPTVAGQFAHGRGRTCGYSKGIEKDFYQELRL